MPDNNIMEEICQELFNKNWTSIKIAIKKDIIDWDYLVDQINGTIHYLAYHEQFDLIKFIDAHTLSEIIDQKNAEGNTICHIAALMNNMEILSLAISLNQTVIYQRNRLGYAPLFYSVMNNTLIEEISQNIQIMDHYLNDEYTLLEYYVLKQNMPTLNILLENIKLSNHTNHILFTIIQSENSSNDKINLLELFISKGLNINEMNRDFLSLLIVAVHMDDIKIIKYLLENGADVNYSGPENEHNPLSLAIINCNTKVIKLLLSYDINLEISNKYLQTPLHHLFYLNRCRNITTELKKSILQKTSNVNCTDYRMNSVLNLIIQNDDWIQYENILEELKLKIYVKNKDGYSPYDYLVKEKTNLEQFMYMVYKSYLNQLDSDVDLIDKQDKMIALMLENGDEISDFKSIIMDKIRVQSYPIVKKNDPLKMIVAQETNMTKFSADMYNYICFLCYILQKYPTIKTPGLPTEQVDGKTLRHMYDEMIMDYKSNSEDDIIFRSLIRDHINHSPILINHLIIWRNKEKYFFSPYIIQGIQKTLINYPDTEFIILKLTIVGARNLNHANVIIYDIKNKVIERFDPYGSVPFIDSATIDLFLKSFFGDYIPNATYLSPDDVSKGISFQVYSDENNDSNYVVNDPNGFCMAWCIWYIEMRYKNKNIPPDVLVKKTVYQINKSENKFKDYIRNYSNYIDYEKNLILQKSGVPKKMWYIHSLPINVYKSYLKYIRKICDLVL
jgi:ankyrin repeat protein